MRTTSHYFKTFPQFSRLRLSDKDAYEDLIKNYPPISSFSFPTLMTWWNSLGACRVSQLNGNLVISHWFPGDEEVSGLSIVGTKQIDNTICTIFDHLANKKEAQKLVHVPEFVVHSMKYPDMFSISCNRAYDECILSIEHLYKLTSLSPYLRSKVYRFKIENEQKDIRVKKLDLSIVPNRQVLLNTINEWPSTQFNRKVKRIKEYFIDTVNNAAEFYMDSLCLLVNGKIHGFILYQLPSDKDFVIINFARFSYEMNGLFEFACHKFAEYFYSQQVKFANIEADFNDNFLRTTKLSLGPYNFFRKYTIKPKSSKT